MKKKVAKAKSSTSKSPASTSFFSKSDKGGFFANASGNQGLGSKRRVKQAGSEDSTLLQSNLSVQKKDGDAPSLSGTSIPSPVIVSSESGISATVFFAQDSFLLDSKNLEAVQSLRRKLRFSFDPSISVNGYASSEGSTDYNQALSDNRRFAVVSLLRASDETRSVAMGGRGFGESRPMSTETGTESDVQNARTLNRRVDIQITFPPTSSQRSARDPLDLDGIMDKYKRQMAWEYLERQTPPGFTIPPPSQPHSSPAPKGPDTPRPGKMGDILKAIMKDPNVKKTIDGLKERAADRLRRDWERLSTGEKAAVISQTAIIAGGTLTAAMSHPESRAFILKHLDGKKIPIPKTPLSITPQIKNRGAIITIDIGSLLRD